MAMTTPSQSPDAKISTNTGHKQVSNILAYLKDNWQDWPNKSLEYIELGLRTGGRTSGNGLELRYYQVLIQIKLEQYEEAKTQLKRILETANANGYKKQAMMAMHGFAVLAYKTKRTERALRIIDQALVLTVSLNDSRLLGSFYRVRALVYRSLHDYDRALEASFIAYKNFEKTDDKKLMILSLINQTTIYRTIAIYDKALTSQLKALTLANITGNERRLATNYNNAAVIYKDLGDYEQAIEMNLKSLALKASLGYTKGIIYSHNNVGEVYRLNKNYSLAIEHLTKARALATSSGHERLLHTTLLYLGRTLRDVKQFEKAEEYLTRVNLYFLKIKHAHRTSDSYLALGRLSHAMGNHLGAIEYLKLAIDYSNKIKKNRVKLQALQELSIVYEALNKFEAAYATEKLTRQLHDAIYNRRRSHFISTLKIEYQFEEKQREIAMLKQKNRIKTLQLENHRVTLATYVTLLLLAFSLVVFLYYRYNQKRKMDAERLSFSMLQQQELAVRALNAKLEEMVSQRTLSLSEANKKLKITLFELTSTQKTLIETEKIASLGGLVAGIAHEINTPLGTIMTAVSCIQQQLTAFNVLVANQQVSRIGLDDFLSAIKQSSHLAERNSYRVSTLIQQFQQVSIETRNEPAEHFDLTHIVSLVIATLLSRPEFLHVNCTINKPAPIILFSYPSCWFQILESLMSNSVEHGFVNGKGEVNIAFCQAGELVRVTFIDNGCGMDEAQSDHIFEPFYTSMRNQGHIGLGLPIIFNLVSQSLNGSIRLDRTSESGACFIIEIPVSLPSA